MVMSLRFRGDYAKLQRYAGRVDHRGVWRDLDCGGKQYRTDDGAVLNWWKKHGKILFQGHGQAARKFEQAFKAVATRRLTGDDDGDKGVEVLRHENETLRALIADLMLKNARLRKRLKREPQGHPL
jgi:hypothetical protein